jgi:N6-adenosine-specific RNA methylase IME4
MLDSFAAKLSFNEQTRLELFARETVPGWSVYGFEAGVALAAE